MSELDTIIDGPAEDELNKWREAWHREGERARDLEAWARERGLPADKFNVRPSWPGLDWVEHGYSHIEEDDSLPRFREMVATTVALLGPVDKVEGKHWIGSYNDQPPDLVATWFIKREGDFAVNVTVRMLSPKGCKVDPRSEFKAAKETALHPECVAALAEIEELGAE